jgi:hypothetical protein
VTAALPESANLPLWRLITGVAVLGTLVLLVVMAGWVYADNFLLDRYMRALAAQPGSAGLSDTALSDRVMERAKQLDLPVAAGDIRITRSGGRPHIRIARYGVQTKVVRMDLRFPEAESH